MFQSTTGKTMTLTLKLMNRGDDIIHPETREIVWAKGQIFSSEEVALLVWNIGVDTADVILMPDFI